MGEHRTFYGEIPGRWIADPGRVREILDTYSGEPISGQDSAYRYPDPFTWACQDGGLSILARTKDWESWVEESLKAIAPHIRGQHEIQVEGEEGDHWLLVLRGGRLYEQELVHTRTGRSRIWGETPPNRPRD